MRTTLFFILTTLYTTAGRAQLAIETFGDKNNPAVLLNAGAGDQSVTWPEALCENLARKYYVIRYDYRDTGLSSKGNYDETPYSTMDLMEDAINILKGQSLEKAHFVGFSMGGQVAQLAAAYQPDHVLSLTLIGTSRNFKPGFDAMEGLPRDESALSPPIQSYVDWCRREQSENPTPEQQEKDYLHNLFLQDGQSPNFDAAYAKARYAAIQKRTEAGSLPPYPIHAKAMKAGHAMHLDAAAKITCPTLIIQGAKDPVFPYDHGCNLHKLIDNSRFVVLEDFAHAITSRQVDVLAKTIGAFIEAPEEFIESA